MIRRDYVMKTFNDSVYMTLGEWITQNFRELLEQKHLYQNYKLDQGAIAAKIEKEIVERPKELADELRGLYRKILDRGWYVVEKPQLITRTIVNNDELPDDLPLGFALPTIKVYCSICERQEAFNPVGASPVLENASANCRISVTPNIAVQVFALAYQCQSCKGLPEIFLVRREGLRLILQGRSPIEQVVTPYFIPKSVKQYYRRAIVAFQSGETLAALFLLRVLIEQYARSESINKNGKVDAMIDEYMIKLPDDFKIRFPSLREYWDKLSEAIHTANESEDLFQEARSKIERHFDAKRLLDRQLAHDTSTTIVRVGVVAIRKVEDGGQHGMEPQQR